MKCLDIGRIEDVHFWPFWSEDACLTSARMGEAFTLRQTDSQFIHNCFAWGYHRGMHLLSNDKESGNTPNGLFTNISFDGIDIGIEIEGANYVGVDLTNVFIACLDNYGQTTRTAIIGHDNIGPVSIVNGSFWGAYKSEIIRWDGGGPLTISSSQFRDWKAGDAAIRINGGRAIISGNSFQDTHGKSVYIDSKADRVIIANNLITGNPIDNHGTQTAISNNL